MSAAEGGFALVAGQHLVDVVVSALVGGRSAS
jgi:hypothetical protein